MPPVDFTTLETARLHLRHFREEDIGAFVAYRNDPEVARYQGWESTDTTEAHEFIQEQKTMPLGGRVSLCHPQGRMAAQA